MHLKVSYIVYFCPGTCVKKQGKSFNIRQFSSCSRILNSGTSTSKKCFEKSGGSSNPELSETEGSRNRDSTVFVFCWLPSAMLSGVATL